MRMKSLLLGSMAALIGIGTPIGNFMMPHADYRNRGAAKRRKTGITYPMNGKRECARRVRQMEARAHG